MNARGKQSRGLRDWATQIYKLPLITWRYIATDFADKVYFWYMMACQWSFHVIWWTLKSIFLLF